MQHTRLLKFAYWMFRLASFAFLLSSAALVFSITMQVFLEIRAPLKVAPIDLIGRFIMFLFFREMALITHAARLKMELEEIPTRLKRGIGLLIGSYLLDIAYNFSAWIGVKEIRQSLYDAVDAQQSASWSIEYLDLLLKQISNEIAIEMVFPIPNGATSLVLAFLLFLMLKFLEDNQNLGDKVEALEKDASLTV